MTWQYTPFALISGAGGLLAAALAFQAWARRRQTPAAASLAALMLGVAIWCLAYAGELAAVGLEVKLVWARLEYLGIATAPVAWAVFAARYTGRGAWVRGRTLALLSLEPLTIVALAWADQGHGPLWSSARLVADSGRTFLVLGHGPAFWSHWLYSNLLLLGGTLVMLRWIADAPHLPRGQSALILTGIAAPWVTNAAYVSGYSPAPLFDLTPFGFLVTGLAVGWGLLRFGLLDLVPLARTALIDDMADGVMVLDGKGRVVDLNPAAARLIGQPARAAIGAPAAQLLPGGRDLLEPGAQHEARSRIVLVGAEPRCLELRVSSLKRSSGELAGRLLVLRDITETNRAEEALRASEARFRMLSTHAPVGIFLTDPKGDCLYVNPRWCELAGLTPEQAAGPGWGRAVHPEDRDRVFSEWSAAAAAGREFVSEYRFQNPRRTSWLIGNAVPLRDSRGDTTGFIGTILDVTERKQVEEALASARTTESLSVLTGGLAHNFNNLLNVVMSRIELAGAKLDPDSPARTHVEKAASAAKRAARLVHLMTTYVGRGQSQTHALDLSRLLEESLDLLEASLPPNVRLCARLAPDLPPIHADPAQMQQATVELLVNAAEAIGAASGLVTLTTGTHEIGPDDSRFWRHTGRPLALGPHVTLAVADTGAGIAAGVLPRIFEPFFTTRFTGRGLGLAAVLGIVRGQGGGVDVRSEPGVGTTFEMVFPVAREPLAS